MRLNGGTSSNSLSNSVSETSIRPTTSSSRYSLHAPPEPSGSSWMIKDELPSSAYSESRSSNSGSGDGEGGGAPNQSIPTSGEVERMMTWSMDGQLSSNIRIPNSWPSVRLPLHREWVTERNLEGPPEETVRFRGAGGGVTGTGTGTGTGMNPVKEEVEDESSSATSMILELCSLPRSSSSGMVGESMTMIAGVGVGGKTSEIGESETVGAVSKDATNVAGSVLVDVDCTGDGDWGGSGGGGGVNNDARPPAGERTAGSECRRVTRVLSRDDLVEPTATGIGGGGAGASHSSPSAGGRVSTTLPTSSDFFLRAPRWRRKEKEARRMRRARHALRHRRPGEG